MKHLGPIPYEAFMNFIRPLGKDPEALWKKETKPILGDKMACLLDSLRYDPVCRGTFATAISLETANSAMLSCLAMQNQSFYNFWSAGKKVFQVSSDLSKMLQGTDLRVSKFLLHLPFQCIYVRFEEAPFDIYCDWDKSWIPIDGVFLWEGPFERERQLSSKEIAMLLSDSKQDLPELPREHTLRVVAMSKVDSRGQGNIIHGTLRWDFDDETLVDAERVDQCLPEWEYKNELTPSIRLALLVVAYVNSVNSDVKRADSPAENKNRELSKQQGRSPKKLFKAAASLSKLGYYAVGDSIRIPDGYAPVRETQEHKGFRTHTFRYHVRGHMKNQPCGPGRRDRKAIWVKPYMRGPDTAEVLNKAYSVEPRS